MLDNLINVGEIPPKIAIFIAQSPQPQRNFELSNNAPFADFVAEELLPDFARSGALQRIPHKPSYADRVRVAWLPSFLHSTGPTYSATCWRNPQPNGRVRNARTPITNG